VRATLFVNPNSGDGSAVDDVVARARAEGIEVHLLGPGDDVAALARKAEADVLGMAGGDGSLSAVAEVAIERDVPFVCVPTGTRNHFARDAGLATDDPAAAVDAFMHGVERRIDVGRAHDRLFLNNVSLGIYARVVHQRERRRRRDEALARVRALVTSMRHGAWNQHFRVDGMPIRASVLLIANNEYTLDVRTFGERERLDGGTLAVYAARGLRRLRWTERTAKEVQVETPHRTVRAAVDGEPCHLESPVRLRVDPGALRLLMPPEPDRAPATAGSELEDEE
jgi:diacylglycerol kinase family enzyme